MTQTIDITPTWRSLVGPLVSLAEHGDTFASRAEALRELGRMASAADAWNAHVRIIQSQAERTPSHMGVGHDVLECAGCAQELTPNV